MKFTKSINSIYQMTWIREGLPSLAHTERIAHRFGTRSPESHERAIALAEELIDEYNKHLHPMEKKRILVKIEEVETIVRTEEIIRYHIKN